MRAFWYRGYFFLQHLTFNFDVAFFCFSTWGESSFKACQTCFLVFLFFYYTKRTVAAILFPFLYGAIAYVLLSGLIPISILVQLTSLNILLLSISRVSSLKIMLIACSELAARFINLGKERGGWSAYWTPSQLHIRSKISQCPLRNALAQTNPFYSTLSHNQKNLVRDKSFSLAGDLLGNLRTLCVLSEKPRS